MAFLLALLLAQSTDPLEPFPPTPFDRVIPIVIDAGDAVLDGHGHAERVAYRAEFSGTLHLWTTTGGELDVFIRVETPSGELVVEDDNSGALTTPYVKLEVERGREFVIVTASVRVEPLGSCELHAIAAPETDATRAAAESALAALEEIKRLREAQDLASARKAAKESLETLRGVPGAEASELVHASLLALGQQTSAVSDVRSTRSTWTHATRNRARTLPAQHLDLQVARTGLAKTLQITGEMAGARELQELVLDVFERTLPAEHSNLQAARGNLANTLLKTGDLAGARTLLESLLEVYERTLPADHPNLQAARANLASTLYTLGHLAGARALQERVLEVLERTLPPDHGDLQTVRRHLALTRFTLGDLAGARALQESVLEISERTLPAEHPNLQATRIELAASIAGLGDLSGSRDLHARGLEMLERTLPGDHLDLQGARLGLASTLYLLGDLAGARALEERVLKILERTLPADHPELQRARANLAQTLCALGDLAGARELQELVLEVLERTLPGEHPSLQTARANLAGTIDAQGDPDGARTLFERVLEVRERTLPAEHPDLQQTRTNLAVTIRQLGDPAAARALLERVLEVSERTLPGEHPTLQATRTNLAVTLFELGDLAAARVLQERVLEVSERTLPPEHPTLQATRTNLAVTLRLLGDVGGARALLERVLEVRERTLPPEHPDLQTVCGNLALVLGDLGDPAGARSLLSRALEVQERTLPSDHNALQSTRANLAGMLKDLGDLAGARLLLERVLEVRERTLPAEHPGLQRVRGKLAATLLVQAADSARAAAGGERSKDWDGIRGSAADLLRARSLAEAHVANEARLNTPGREAEARCQSLSSSLGFTLSAGLGYGNLAPLGDLIPEVFVLSESTRNASLSSSALARRASRLEGYPAARERLRRATDELARLVQAGTGSEGYAQALGERESAEHALIAMGRAASSGAPSGIEIDGERLSSALRVGQAAIAFRAYTRFGLEWIDASQPGESPRPRETWVESLCAFVVRSRADSSDAADAPALALIDLGPLAAIREDVGAWQAALGVEGKDLRGLASTGSKAAPASDRGAALRARILDPLLSSLGDPRHLVLVPDDVLSLVPFEVLPAIHAFSGPSGAGERDEEFLGDQYRIEVRATLSELLDAPLSQEGANALVALGGASFASTPLQFGVEDDADSGAVPEVGLRAAGLVRGTAFDRGFDPLPGTVEEARGLNVLFGDVFGERGQALLLEKRKASRAALQELAPRARWLHIATHGWFAPESMKSWSDRDPADERLGFASMQSGEETVRGMSPMLLCGLALAGANLAEDAFGRPPGLVTADELSSLDLSNCELAVLSACDTARGEMRRAGQGVASLQKALQIAGARSVVTSLWKVPDEATKELMLDFYRRVWVEQTPKWRALWEAKQRLRNAKDGRGEPRYKLRDWAAWVLTGEPE